MPYVTTVASIRYRQMSLMDLFEAPEGAAAPSPVGRPGDTKTYYYDVLPEKYRDPRIISACIVALRDFVNKHAALYEVERNTLYHSFTVLKSDGHSRRPIDAPNPDLMEALRELKAILEDKFAASHHTSAFAYVRKRCHLDAVKRHQSNESRWFLKVDCSNFFGSITPEFTYRMLEQIWPFSEVMNTPAGGELMSKALDLAFLNGGLPQGTPLSPMLTNIIMIPIDHCLFNKLRDFDDKHFVYTRYADDIDVSCRFDFNFTSVIDLIQETFDEFNAPLSFKREKTHYGSSNGRNWILGVMFNEKGQITIGYRQKQRFRAMTACYMKDRRSGNRWPLSEIQSLQGLLAYYTKVDPAYFAMFNTHFTKKFGVDLKKTLIADIKEWSE